MGDRMRDSRSIRRVIIVDDSRTMQAMLDNAFSKRADFQVVGFCGDAKMAAEMVHRLVPDIVTIDLCMPYLDGAALLEMVSDLDHVCKIIVSDQPFKNILLCSKLLEAGASACLSKRDLVDNPASFFKKIDAAVKSLDLSRKHHHGDPRCSSGRPGQHLALSVSADVPFPVPTDEAERLRILRSKNLSNGERERHFDLVTKYVSKVTDFPVCLITFIDRDIQWIKSSTGLEIESTPRNQAFCNYTIMQGGAFVVANATSDVRFSGNPLVTGGPTIRSYAGHPITTSDGVTVGALCVIDNRVRTVSKHVLDQLAGMAEIVGEMINQRPALAA